MKNGQSHPMRSGVNVEVFPVFFCEGPNLQLDGQPVAGVELLPLRCNIQKVKSSILPRTKMMNS